MNFEVKMDTKAFRQELEKNVEPEIEKLAYQEAEKIVEENKRVMLAEFDAHPVTKEIKTGPDAQNSSKTLGGYGNLFSFIVSVHVKECTYIHVYIFCIPAQSKMPL